jgi:hypothetical protein
MKTPEDIRRLERGENAMDIQKGDRVLVNVAPFIASTRRQRDTVLCEVLEVSGTAVRVITQSPCREVDVWVESRWIDRVLPEGELFSQSNPA